MWIIQYVDSKNLANWKIQLKINVAVKFTGIIAIHTDRVMWVKGEAKASWVVAISPIASPCIAQSMQSNTMSSHLRYALPWKNKKSQR